MTVVWLQSIRTRAVVALIALILLTAAMLGLRDQLDKAHVAMLYLLLVLGGSAAGRMVGLSLGVSAFGLFNFFFLPPYNTLAIADPRDWLVLVAFLITSITAAELMNRQRVQSALAEQRRVELEQLATLGAETVNAARAEHALVAIAQVIRSTVGVPHCDLFVGKSARSLRAIGVSQEVSDGSESLSAYVAESGRTAIARVDGTAHIVLDPQAMLVSPLSEAVALAMPLAIRGQTVGVLRVSDDDGLKLNAEKLRTLSALAYYAALGIERLRLEETEDLADALRRADRQKDSLLAAVSHDLRTPLTTIKAMAHEIALAGSEKAQIIEEEADQLAQLVDGLLQLSQLSANAMPVRLTINTADDLIGAALQRAHKALATHDVRVAYQGTSLFAAHYDFGHTLRILVNLLENAAKYSSPDSRIDIGVSRQAATVQIDVLDRGPGVAADETPRIFEPFYRSPNAPADVRGAGLGLSIAKRLAEAQGGSLDVHSREGGGTTFSLRLRAAEELPA